MIKANIIVTLTLALSPAWAQPAELTDEAKVHALKRAYELNGNSMKRWGSIDLTDPDPTKPLFFVEPNESLHYRLTPPPLPQAPYQNKPPRKRSTQ